MEFSIALLTFGVILLLVGIAGKIQAKELSVGTDSAISRVVIGIVGAVLIAMALSQQGINWQTFTGDKQPSEKTDHDDDKNQIIPFKPDATTELSAEAVAAKKAEEEAAAALAEAAKVKAQLEALQKEVQAKEKQKAAAPKSKTIKVLPSSYGILREYCDPTDKIKMFCEGQRHCRVKIDNSLCGDPLKDHVKEARIFYRCGAQQKELVTPEEEVAYLSCE